MRSRFDFFHICISYTHTHLHTLAHTHVLLRVDHHGVLEVWPHISNMIPALLTDPILMFIWIHMVGNMKVVLLKTASLQTTSHSMSPYIN